MFATSDLRQRSYWEIEHGFRVYNHPVVRFFARQRLDYVRTWLDLNDVESALDVGCGDGSSTYYMREHVRNICGVDRSRRMLLRHPLRTAGRVAMADVFRLPFGDKTFDLVYGWEVLHHISDPTLAIAEMARISRRYVLVVEPNRNNPFQFAFALFDREHRWVLQYTREYLRRLLESAGLYIEHVGCGGWVFPNKTPQWLLPLLRWLPYRSPLGISNWALGRKK